MYVLVIIGFLLISVYNYFGLRSLFIHNKIMYSVYTIGYVSLTLLVVYSFYQIFYVIDFKYIFRNKTANIYFGIVLIALATQATIFSVLLIQDMIRGAIGLYHLALEKFSNDTKLETTDYIPSRRKFVSNVAIGLAAIPFFAMIYGMAKGKYKYTIEKIQLAFNDLPPAFDGLRIVQISDIHAGSLDSEADVRRGIQMVNDLKPDIILFTGDLVNANKDEVDPFIEIFSTLKSKYGNYAVLGNHDYYGEYGMSTTEVSQYRKEFYEKFEAMGFKLLNNEADRLQIGQESIAIVGVENWGAGKWFPKRGDLSKALENVNEQDFKILMSHDPTHWEQHVLSHNENIHLTLSGHTHGMQFGLKMPGFRWSPVKYKYKHWMGLYEEEGQYLYVNRGFGFLGFPGRIGMWPEITLIELNTV